MVVVVALVAVVGVTGASAFTTATVARNAQIDVAADENAVIGLEPGPVSGVDTTDGQLSVALGQEGSASGLNADGTFAYGDNSSATSTYAFAVTNNDSDTRYFEFSYALTNTDPDTNTDNVEFELFDDSGSAVSGDAGRASATEDDDLTSVSIGSGTTYYVVIVVDTTGVSSGNSLDGTLTVSASASS